MQQAISKGLEFLLSAQGPDGGWSYVPRAQSSPEPTCHALLAGVAADAAQRGLAWLQSRVNDDGALTLQGDSEPHWTTSLFVLTLARIGAAPQARDKSLLWLLASEGKRAERQEEVVLDSTLLGWPWMGDTFSWVEPTSLALLAVKTCGRRDHARVAEAERLLIDRACQDGGWNVGNHTVFGARLFGLAPTTALAALALQGARSGVEAVRRALAFLNREIAVRPSALSLAMTILCLGAHGRPTSDLADALARRQEADGSWRRQVHLTALAVSALDAAAGGDNVFKL